jgi:hypothetical protein
MTSANQAPIVDGRESGVKLGQERCQPSFGLPTEARVVRLLVHLRGVLFRAASVDILRVRS